MFSLHLSTPVILLLSASIVPVLFLLVFYRKRVSSINRYTNTPVREQDSELPPVSVIIYSNNDADYLSAMLPEVLTQEYPAPMEVIVVNDGSCETTKDIVEHLAASHSNLYLTFTPDEARNLSRKKLALTIGIKAARHDIVVITNANTRITSGKWLSLIARHFTEGKDIVIGYGAPCPDNDSRPHRRLRAFDMSVDAVTYLSAAIAGKPYRGNGCNLAYRRKLFFDNKGFSRSLNLHFGDDDIFINEIANGTNTAVELSREAQVTCLYHDPATAHRTLKQQYDFTSRYLRKGSQRFFGFSSAMMWTWVLISAAAIFTSLPNLVPTAITMAFALILWIPLMLAWHKTLLALGSRKLLFTIPFFLLFRPIYNTCYRFRSKHSRHRNFTWEH
ncbi:MAG: glycosyltransferase [Muribaculaceae bacterium]|nr:glycosyltransferase [Muribaculaceae bacterium]